MKKVILILTLVGFVFAGDLTTPIPRKIDINNELALAGKELFFDKALSYDKSLSCASCHNPKYGWADNRAKSIGVKNQIDDINTPTVLNSIFNFRQFWNGRVDTLQKQLDDTFHNPIEMAMSRSLIEKRINCTSKYKKLFNKEYIEYKDVLDAISEFVKSLITPDSKFDKFLRDEVKLSKKERDGYKLFKKIGCITCHNGINMGGNSFQKIGTIYKFEDCVGDKFSITKKEIDRCVFKVPTLRNIALTAPYFHNGSSKTLKDAIIKMAHFNLGFPLDKEEVENIEAFLKTLTGEILYRDEDE